MTITTMISKCMPIDPKEVFSHIGGYFGARFATKYTLATINPLAITASISTGIIVIRISSTVFNKIKNFFLDRLIGCKNSNSSLRKDYESNKYNIKQIIKSSDFLIQSTLAFASGFAVYAAISTLTTTHLIGINILAFAIEVATDRLL